MRTSQAARYARWAAAAAILLTVFVAGVYLRRSWQARQARQQAPAPVPATVQRRSAEFSFSKVEKERTIFTVRASQATSFKQGSKNLLEDVWITVYGRSGQRFDNIHTQSCDYIADQGQVVCSGKVQIDLESAADAKRYGSDPHNPQSAAHMEQVETSDLHFDRETGIARTDREVNFRFPEGEGHAVGTSYDSREGILRLLSKVEVTVRPRREPIPAVGPPAPVTLSSASLEYRHEERILRLSGPVRAQQGARELRAGELAVELDTDLHVRRVVARPAGPRQQVELRSAEQRGAVTLNADEFVVSMNPEGWVERAEANGTVRGGVATESGEDRLSAAHMELQMAARENQPETLTASGEVLGLSARRERVQRLETSALLVSFAPKGPKGQRELDHAETLAAGTMEWQVLGAPGQPPRESTKITGQSLGAEFGPRGRLRSAAARNGMSVERRVAERPVEYSSAREATVGFDADGEWSTVEETGNVKFREGVNAGQAEHAKIDRAADLITLTGGVQVTDGTMRLTSQSATFNHRTEDFRADVGVRTTYLKVEPGSVTNLAPQPAFLVADRLEGNSSGGRALYTGHARMWQGDSAIEADSIELLRDAKRLAARGKVTAAFLQAPGASPIPQRAPASAASSGRPELWRMRAGALTYLSGEARALLEGGVAAESSQAGMSSKTLELFFAPAGSPPGPTQPGNAGGVAGSGALQLARAVARGGVVVRQGERRGTAEKAEYVAAEQKFTLSGGNPTLSDAAQGTTTGRQLTFFFASDTILVDSAEGSRTLTKHRVEK
jgi:LPS export ABC transporter protein LptC